MSVHLARLGPDQGLAAVAWGAAARQPVIATTPKAAGQYPRAALAARKEAVAPAFAAEGASLAPRARVRLSSSTARPKPRERPAAPVAGAWRAAPRSAGGAEREGTAFRTFYLRGDIPVCIGHGAKRRVRWKCDVGSLDYHHYLPLFMDGLCETQEPFCFIALAGVSDMLEQGGTKVLAVVPQLIQPIKRALNTKNRATIARVLQVLMQLVNCAPHVGEALVPYYRQLLPVFNTVLLLEPRRSMGDGIDYGQQKRENLVDLVNETLEELEATGGATAFLNIKYLVPSFETTQGFTE
jgi:hypothetical protein